MGPDSYIGSICSFAGGTTRGTIQGWLPCEGQSMTIAQHEALYSIIGTKFGGDGTHSFKLPDLRTKDSSGAPQPWGDHPASMICVEGTYPNWD